jgi:ABC-type multidrug transport system fused ATPase/permease subunit
VRKFLLCDEYEPVSSGSLKEREISVRDGTFVYESKKPKIDLTAGLTEERRNFLWEIDLLKAQLHAAEEQLKTVSRNCVEQQNDDGFEDNELNIDESNVEDLLALKRINLSCAKGELVAVCGEVAGGKSSLVNCILGELKRVAGNVSVKGKMAYFPQTPFIMNDTVQGNILFGQRNEDLDAELYNRAISCCALEHDLKLLSHGDKTEIGERGVNLSGGQKARLALARCVYFSEADFYLLDDPLAAVDAHVGAHIFQKCIIDEIVKNRGKGVILVTNAVQYLSDPNVHKIAVMQAGSIVEAGSYTDLTSSGDSVFSSLLGAAGSKVSYGYKSSQKDSIKSSTLEAINTPNKMSIISSSSSPENRQSQISTEAEVIADLMSETNESTTLGKASEALMTDEFTEREKGHVDKDIYLAWLAAAGGFCIGLLVLLSYAVDQSVIIASKW